MAAAVDDMQGVFVVSEDVRAHVRRTGAWPDEINWVSLDKFDEARLERFIAANGHTRIGVLTIYSSAFDLTDVGVAEDVVHRLIRELKVAKVHVDCGGNWHLYFTPAFWTSLHDCPKLVELGFVEESTFAQEHMPALRAALAVPGLRDIDFTYCKFETSAFGDPELYLVNESVHTLSVDGCQLEMYEVAQMWTYAARCLPHIRTCSITEEVTEAGNGASEETIAIMVAALTELLPRLTHLTVPPMPSLSLMDLLNALGDDGLQVANLTLDLLKWDEIDAGTLEYLITKGQLQRQEAAALELLNFAHLREDNVRSALFTQCCSSLTVHVPSVAEPFGGAFQTPLQKDECKVRTLRIECYTAETLNAHDTHRLLREFTNPRHPLHLTLNGVFGDDSHLTPNLVHVLNADTNHNLKTLTMDYMPDKYEYLRLQETLNTATAVVFVSPWKDAAHAAMQRKYMRRNRALARFGPVKQMMLLPEVRHDVPSDVLRLIAGYAGGLDPAPRRPLRRLTRASSGAAAPKVAAATTAVVPPRGVYEGLG